MLNYLTEQGLHESHISEIFEGRVKYEHNTSIFEEPLVIILFTNRCGSNLFAEHLINTGYIGGLREAINHSRVGRIQAERQSSSYPDFFAADAKACIDGGKLFGVKASVGQLAMLHRWNILAMFSGMVVFQIVREDMLDQAISMSIAKQTGRWSSELTGRVTTETIFDFAEIHKFIVRNYEQNAAGKLLMDSLNVPSTTFRYEEFSANPKPDIAKALCILGIEDENIQVAEPKLKKQADEINKIFRENFLKEISFRVS